MEIKQLSGKLQSIVGKYRYAVLVLVIGLVLLLLPGKATQSEQPINESKPVNNQQATEMEALTEILQSIQGAGKVRVLLSMASGEETIYQTNSDNSASGDSTGTRIETVIITDSQRNEAGLIQQINPPTYRGAIVVCQGAHSATVRFAITQAVAKITGLGTDDICVLKMK